MDQLHYFSRQSEMKEIKSKFRRCVSFHMLGTQESRLNQLPTDLQLPEPKRKSRVAATFLRNDSAGIGRQMVSLGQCVAFTTIGEKSLSQDRS